MTISTNLTFHDQTAMWLQQINICMYIQQIADFIIKLSFPKILVMATGINFLFFSK